MLSNEHGLMLEDFLNTNPNFKKQYFSRNLLKCLVSDQLGKCGCDCHSCDESDEQYHYKRNPTKRRICSEETREEFSLVKSIIPDAYLIEPSDRTVTCVEVELSSIMSTKRIESYTQIWFLLDCYEWNLKLLIVDKFGNHNKIDLMNAFYDMLRDHDQKLYLPKYVIKNEDSQRPIV